MAVAGTSLIHLGYFALLQWAYRGGDLSVVYPVARGAGPLLTVAYALALLGERPGWLPLAGCLAILAGIAGLTGLGRRSLRLDRSTRAGLLVGVCIAAYTLWDRWAVVEVGVPPVSYLWLQSVGYAALLTPRVLRSGRGRRLRDVPVRAAVAVAVLSATSYLIVLEVLTFAPVSLVAPLREVSILVAALLGRLLLREPMTAQKAASATLVMAGVGAIALG
jgi:drug/metabolite transporter (DMT)-like permease